MALNSSTAINTGQATIATASTLLVLGRNRRNRVFIVNMDGANPIFIGSTNAVSLVTGFKVAAGVTQVFEYQGDVYAIAQSASVIVSFCEEYGTP